METMTTTRPTSLALAEKNKIEEAVKNALSHEENTIRLAMIQSEQNKRLGDMLPLELLGLSAQIIKQAYTRLGLKTPLDMEDLQEVIFCDLKDFLSLNRSEVLLALKSGLDGEYSGENGVFFNPSNFVQWLKRYKNEKRRNVMAKILKIEERTKQIINPPPPPSEAEEKNTFVEATNQYIAAFEENPEFEFFAPVWMMYDYLERFGFYSLDKEQKEAIFSRVKALPQCRGLGIEELKKQAKNEAYRLFCRKLAKESKRLTIKGIITKS